MLKTQSFFDLTDFSHAALFSPTEPVWSALNDLKDYMDSHSYPSLDKSKLHDGMPLTQTMVLWRGEVVDSHDLKITYGDTLKGNLEVTRDGERLAGASVIMAGAVLMGDRLDIGQGVLVETGAMIKSPAIIGDNTEVRQGAYLRGYCLAGARCVIGHTTEVKHSIFLDDAKAGHFNYLGDSILGRDANLGAGTKFANLRFIKGNVVLIVEGERIDTGRRKFGAILGDEAQTGCNSVTSPGTLLGQGAMVMPNATVPAGYHPPRSVIRQ